MFSPTYLYIGFRYLRAKRRNRFISFISLASMLGIALGVGVLITVMSVMNGFDAQIRERIFSMAPQVVVSDFSGELKDWPSLEDKVSHFPNVLKTAPFISGQGLITKGSLVHPVFVKGILPAKEAEISGLASSMITGQISSLKPAQFGMVLGKNLAESLGVAVGDKVTLMTPKASFSPFGLVPQWKRVTVVGIFYVGTGFGFDDSYAFLHLQDAQKLYGMDKSISGIQLKINDLFAAPNFSLDLLRKLNFRYSVSNWTELYGGFYHAVEMEKTMMFFILSLLIAIAAFNLVSSLVMLVNEKQSDIAILRTFGATPSLITKIFITQGFTTGLIGTLLGIILGIVLSLNATAIVEWIQHVLHTQLLSPNVYFVNYLPSQLSWMDVLKVGIIAMAMSLLATIYPAWRASRVNPVEALRYE